MTPLERRRPFLHLLACVLCLLACLLVPPACRADEKTSPNPTPASPSPQGTPSPAGSPDPGIKPAEKPPENKPVSGRVYVQGGYNYNFAGPGAVNDFHLFDNRANALTLDILQFLIEKETTLSHPVGFRVNAMAGSTARYVHAQSLGGPNDTVDLTEAYGRFKAPLGTGLDIEVGKFLTPCGVEYAYAIDDTNYSRSFLYNYAAPITHTGLRVKYEFSDKFNATLYAVNGWDTFKDNNTGKTFGLSLGYNPADAANFTLTVLGGPELPNDNGSTRLLVDWVGAFKPAKDWLILTNFDYGSQKHAPGIGTATWNGFEAIVRRQLGDRFALALRAEYMADPQGFRTGVPQTLKSITFTPEIKLPLDIILRPEFRRDWSNVASFRNGTRNSQDVFGIGVMYQYPFSF